MKLRRWVQVSKIIAISNDANLVVETMKLDLLQKNIVISKKKLIELAVKFTSDNDDFLNGIIKNHTAKA
jgi:hypothetical protein